MMMHVRWMLTKALGVVENRSVDYDLEKTDPVLLKGLCCRYRDNFIDDGLSPSGLFREGVVEITSSWVRFGVHHCRALHCTLFCTREISFRSGTIQGAKQMCL